MFRMILPLAAGLFAAASATAQCGSTSNQHHSRQASWEHQKDLVDVASSSDQFSTLVTALKTAGLVSTLQSDGPFTVFAPANAAFAKLDNSTLKALLQPENKQLLTEILTYHVVAGNFKAADVVNAVKASGGEFTIETVSGGKLKVTVEGATVLLTDEKGGVSAVTMTDVAASNGTIHVIDTVVMPG